MPFIETPIKDLLIFEPKVFSDERGFFFESFNQQHFIERDIDVKFVQDNQSFSKYGTLRGLHFQREPFAQAKLVRVIQGEVFDVAVDLRKDSETFGKYFSIILSSDNKKQLFIPRGFAHGFVVLSETAEFLYKCDNYYSKEHEGGIKFDDESLGIDWVLSEDQFIVSDKDKELGPFVEKYYFENN